MSALPAPPYDRLPPPEPPPRRPRWRRVLAWTGAGLAILIVLLVIAAIVLMRNASFHSYILRVAQEKASAALGAQVQARHLDLRWSGVSPTVDLYDIVVHGAPPYADPPLLQVEQLHLEVRITSLLRRTWYLNDLTIRRPVVHVFVDKQGRDNLPQTKSSGQKSQINIFDVGARHVGLESGEVYYNNRKSALDADLHDLNFRSAFDPAQRRYSGTLSYRDGRLRLGTYNPLPHNLDAQFAATPQTLTLERAVLRSGASQVALNARLEDYAQPKLSARYDATIDAGEFRRILRNPSLPLGVIRANGALDFASQPNRPMLATLNANGTITSRALAVRSGSVRGEIRDISARYSLANGNLEIPDLRARLLGGDLNGRMTMRNIAGESRSHLQASLRRVSLAEVKPLLDSSSLRQVGLSGTASATAEATWGKSFNDLVARADTTVNATLASVDGRNPVPLDGVVHARYAAAGKQLSLSQSYVRTPHNSLKLNGTISQRSSLQVQMQSNELQEVETVVNLFRSAQGGQPPQPLGLYGTASFNGVITGSTTAPLITGEARAANVQLRGSTWKSLRANLDASPSRVRVRGGLLEPADRGRITFDLDAGLRNWAFSESSPVQASVNASQINVAMLAKLSGSTLPVSGTLGMKLSVHGTRLAPAGQGGLQLTSARIAGEQVNSLTVDFNATGEQVESKITLRLPAGAANAAIAYLPKQQGYDARLQARGIRLDQLQAIKNRSLQLTGVLNLNAAGRGTLKDPQLQARAEIPKLEMHGQTISNLTLEAVVANHVANFALDSHVANTQAQARATVNLTGDYAANATLDTQSIPLAPLVAAYAPAQAGNFAGQTELHASLRGPLKNKAQLEAHITIPSLAVSYKNAVDLAAATPIRMDYGNGTLTLQRAVIRGTGTDLQFQGSVPITSSAPMSLLVLGKVDLRLASILDPDVTSAGELQFNINSFGQRTDPNVQGQIRIVNASFAMADVPLGLQEGNGVITLTRDRLNITSFHGKVGGGDVTASGGVAYRPAINFDLALQGQDIRLLYADSIRTGLNTRLALTGSRESAALRGQVRISDLSFTSDFDLQEFMGQLGGETMAPPGEGFSQQLRLDISVQSATGINVASRELSLQGAANLRVRGTAAQPVIVGRVNLTGGDLIFRGNRYLLQDGTIDFVSPSRTEPVVNVAVNTTVQQYDVQMRFWGPADHLHTNYSSNPALPPSDIINLLAFGKTTEAAAANPSPPGALGAQSLVASQVSSQITSRVEKIAGISQLSIDPVLGGGQQNPGARIAIQQRVTSKIFVTFATDVTSTQRQAIKLEYQVTPRVSVSGTRDQNGGFGFDTRIRKSW